VSATPSTVPTKTTTSTPIASSTPSAILTIAASSTPVASPTASAVPTQIASTPTVSSASSTGITYDSKDSTLVFSPGWSTETDAKAYDGTFMLTNVAGSSMTFRFSGMSVSLLYTTKKSYGSMEIYIDNVLAATLNQKANLRFQRNWDSSILSVGAHELKLVFIGPAGTSGSIDAVIVR
jgi:hypothetical protein